MSTKFKGYDQLELLECWGITSDTDNDENWEEDNKSKDERFLWDKIRNGGKEMNKVAGDIRRFLKALHKESTTGGGQDYCGPVWQGMLNIKNDKYGNETLLKFTIYLWDHLWT